MPILSELVASGAPSPAVFGIVADTDDVTPPIGLEQAGIVGRFSNGELDDNVLDTAISWVLAGIQVVIEIPADANPGDAKRLVSTAAAVGVSLSLLPPENPSKEVFDVYCDRVEEFAVAYLSQANMGKMVMPITSYLGYMFMEVYDKSAASSFVPTDPYVVEAFHSRVPVELSDHMKARLRAVICDAYGGEVGFARFARSLGATIIRQVEEGCAEEAEKKGSAPVPAG